MTDATQAETAEPASRERAAWRAKRIKFERLHRDYLAAQAACKDPDGPDDDEQRNALFDRHDEAELALLTMPAPPCGGCLDKMGNPRPPRNDRR